MNKSEGKSMGSWFQRARALGALQGSASAGPGSAERRLAGRSDDGWDPWEIWLTRIEQPRRRRPGPFDGAPD